MAPTTLPTTGSEYKKNPMTRGSEVIGIDMVVLS